MQMNRSRSRTFGSLDPKIFSQSLEQIRHQVLDLRRRGDRLHTKIDVAFNGQPFLPNISPTAPINRRRFEAYLDYHIELQRVLHDATELYLVLCNLSCERQ